MPSYKSNLQEIIIKLKKELDNIKGPVLDKIQRTAASTVVASNDRRIFNNGKAVDGSDIGHYSKSYEKIRIEKGKRVDLVNLTFTGKLSKEFNFEADGSGIGIGFLTPYGANLHDVLEEKYNKKIWGLTQEDESIIIEIEKEEILKALG